MKKLRNFFRGTYLGLMLIFLYAPILVLMVFSFNGSKSMARWAGFSFKWYEALMHDSTIMNALIVTLSVAVISALVATFIGTFAAIGIHSMKKRPRAVVENISRLPMVNPDLVSKICFLQETAPFPTDKISVSSFDSNVRTVAMAGLVLQRIIAVRLPLKAGLIM